MQTPQQMRAHYALTRVQALAQQLDTSKQKEFRSYAYGLPAMIRMNGLGQAAAFYRSKSETHEILYNMLSDWLYGQDQPYHGTADLLDGITQGDMHAYRIAQAEALALLDWVKKFAKAFMEGD